MPIATSTTVLLIAVPLIVWRMASRIRRMIGRQQSKVWRHWAAAIFFPLLIVLLTLSALMVPWGLTAIGAGVAVGIALALWGLRLTKFEKTEQGYFYTPNAHIGIALSLLLVARLGYRMFQLMTIAGADSPASMQEFSRSPMTLMIIGMLAGYYAAYAIGIIQWRRANGTNQEAPS